MRGIRWAASRWWGQAAIIVAVLQVFRVARIALEGSPSAAFANALDVVALQDALGMLHEETMQEWILGSEVLVRSWNVFYGLAHDAVGALAIIFLWRRSRPRYRWARNVAGWMLVVALVGFALYPLTPPRLMPPEFGFVDTGVEVGGIGPIQGATESGGGNRFAAMPSLHVGRALWVTVALWPVLRRRWSRGTAAAYPLVMLFATVATANHWILDGVGGAAALLVAVALERAREHLFRPREASGPPGGCEQASGSAAGLRSVPDRDRNR